MSKDHYETFECQLNQHSKCGQPVVCGCSCHRTTPTQVQDEVITAASPDPETKSKGGQNASDAPESE